MIPFQHRRCAAFRLFILLCPAMLSCGCDGLVNSEFAAMREQWLVKTPPADATPINEIKSGCSSGELESGSEVVIRARINAGEMSPWVRDQAAFIVTDATGHDGSEEHDPHQCPFCRRDIQDHIAMVRFTSEDGKPVPVDARQLLGVAEGELLVIQGTISDTNAEELAINAQRVHIVPAK